MVKVSVIVPIYNAEKYLKRCIDSIVNQDLKEIEIILVNDGSSDSSGEICKSYLTDERVKYISKSNAGAVLARKDGIEKATGEYVGFVDSDDWIEPNMFSTMYYSAKKNIADIVFCNCIENEDDHYLSPEMESGVYTRKNIEELILPKSLAYISKNGDKRAIRWSNCLRLFRRTLLSDIRFNPEIRRCEDLILTYEATIKAQTFVYLGDKYLYHNRIVPNSKSRRYTPDAWRAFRALILHLYEDTKKLNNPQMMSQMHLRAFFSVTDCLDNELKFYKTNKKEALKQIQAVMSDDICERYYGNIPIEQMNEWYQKVYQLIHKKNASGLIRYYYYFKRKQVIEKKVIKPIVGFVSENRVTGKIYKAIRNK